MSKTIQYTTDDKVLYSSNGVNFSDEKPPLKINSVAIDSEKFYKSRKLVSELLSDIEMDFESARDFLENNISNLSEDQIDQLKDIIGEEFVNKLLDQVNSELEDDENLLQNKIEILDGSLHLNNENEVLKVYPHTTFDGDVITENVKHYWQVGGINEEEESIYYTIRLRKLEYNQLYTLRLRSVYEHEGEEYETTSTVQLSTLDPKIAQSPEVRITPTYVQYRDENTDSWSNVTSTTALFDPDENSIFNLNNRIVTFRIGEKYVQMLILGTNNWVDIKHLNTLRGEMVLRGLAIPDRLLRLTADMEVIMGGSNQNDQEGGSNQNDQEEGSDDQERLIDRDDL